MSQTAVPGLSARTTYVIVHILRVVTYTERVDLLFYTNH